jgi:hypothetical protein
MRSLVGLGRSAQPEPALECDRLAHIGDDHGNKITLWCHIPT